MPLGPEDVVRKTFTESRWRPGYNVAEVDAFLEEVVNELRRLNSRLDDLQASARTGSSGVVPSLLEQEEEQLLLIRQERRELAEDLREMQERYDEAIARSPRVGSHPSEGSSD